MSNNSNLSSTKSKQHETHKEDVPLATVLEVFSFVGSCRTTAYLLLGTLNAIVAGFARPASLLYFSSGLGKISAIQEEGLGPVIEVIYAMMVIGVVSLISETLEGETVFLMNFHYAIRLNALFSNFLYCVIFFSGFLRDCCQRYDAELEAKVVRSGRAPRYVIL